MFLPRVQPSIDPECINVRTHIFNQSHISRINTRKRWIFSDMSVVMEINYSLQNDLWDKTKKGWTGSDYENVWLAPGNVLDWWMRIKCPCPCKQWFCLCSCSQITHAKTMFNCSRSYAKEISIESQVHFWVNSVSTRPEKFVHVLLFLLSDDICAGCQDLLRGGWKIHPFGFSLSADQTNDWSRSVLRPIPAIIGIPNEEESTSSIIA